MSEAVTIALISAGLASLVNCIFQFINKIFDNKREEDIYKRNEKKEYLNQKEEVYTLAIERLLEIKVGFDYSRSDLLRNSKKIKQIDESNDRYLKTASLIRIYSTDEIFNRYYELAKFSEFAYSDGRRLIKNSKEFYDYNVTVLARLMQDDLGYRKINDVKEMITCPQCGNEHDIYSKCPKCKMSYGDLLKKMDDIYKQMKEINTELEEDDIKK